MGPCSILGSHWESTLLSLMHGGQGDPSLVNFFQDGMARDIQTLSSHSLCQNPKCSHKLKKFNVI